MDSYDILMEFFIEILATLSGGKLNAFGVIVVLAFGLLMSAVAIVGAVLVSKFTNKNIKLAMTAAVFTALALITTPFFNNAYCSYMRNTLVYMDKLLGDYYTSITQLSQDFSMYAAGASIQILLINAGSAFVLISMILTLVLTGKCFKSKNLKFKALPIVAFILVFVRHFALSNIAVSYIPTIPVLNNVFKVVQLCVFDVAFVVPYILLIPFAILNRNRA